MPHLQTVVSISETPVCMSAWSALPYLQAMSSSGPVAMLTLPEFLPVLETVASYATFPVQTLTPGLLTVPLVRFSFPELTDWMEKNMCHPAQAFLLHHSLPAMEWIPQIRAPEPDDRCVIAVHGMDGVPDTVIEALRACADDRWQFVTAQGPEQYRDLVDTCLRASYCITIGGDINFFRAAAGRRTFMVAPHPTPPFVLSTPYDRFVVSPAAPEAIASTVAVMKRWVDASS